MARSKSLRGASIDWFLWLEGASHYREATLKTRRYLLVVFFIWIFPTEAHPTRSETCPITEGAFALLDSRLPTISHLRLDSKHVGAQLTTMHLPESHSARQETSAPTNFEHASNDLEEGRGPRTITRSKSWLGARGSCFDGCPSERKPSTSTVHRVPSFPTYRAPFETCGCRQQA